MVTGGNARMLWNCLNVGYFYHFLSPQFFGYTTSYIPSKCLLLLTQHFFATPNCFGVSKFFYFLSKFWLFRKKVATMPLIFYCSQKFLPQPSPHHKQATFGQLFCCKHWKIELLGYFGTAVGRGQQQGFTSTKKVSCAICLAVWSPGIYRLIGILYPDCITVSIISRL